MQAIVQARRLRALQRELGEDSSVTMNLRASAEVAGQVLGLHPHPEQMLAALGLYRGLLTEVATGEGKTLAAALAAIARVHEGKRLHILTANDYLARRDAEWMGPLYRARNIRAAWVDAHSTAAERREAYQSDVVYLTAREAGFDYLRDCLARRPAERVQGVLDLALVDEADHILLDEARIPMVLAGPDTEPVPDLLAIHAVAESLQPGFHVQIDGRLRRLSLSYAGEDEVARQLGLAGLHMAEENQLWARVHAALHARFLVQENVDYLIRDDKIELIDAFTSRIATLRRFPWGVQQALQVRHRLPLQAEGRILASVTTRNYLSLYRGLAAMTATAASQADTFSRHYSLEVVAIPSHLPCRRQDLPDRIFATQEAKRQALLAEIRGAHNQSRPVLVGTASIAESESLAGELRANGIACTVLNASHDQEEAALIARAGRLGAVTIATNMAGRGTDIVLDPEHREAVLALGGLLVLGNHRQESRRLDDQLRGRSGRQGDNGASRFLASLEDPLFVRYGVKEFLPVDLQVDAASGEIHDERVQEEVDRAQRLIAGGNAALRDSLHRYSLLVFRDHCRLQEIRRELCDQGVLPPGLLPPERDADLAPLPPAMVQAALGAIDRMWSAHLLRVEEIREGLQLLRYGQRDPWIEFNRLVAAAYDEALATCREEIAAAIARTQQEAMAAENLRPAETWTYLADEEELPAWTLANTPASDAAIASVAGMPLLLIRSLASWIDTLRRSASGGRGRRQAGRDYPG